MIYVVVTIQDINTCKQESSTAAIWGKSWRLCIAVIEGCKMLKLGMTNDLDTKNKAWFVTPLRSNKVIKVL